VTPYERAKLLALELGADAVVIVAIMPDEKAKSWYASNAAFLDPEYGLTWEAVATAVEKTAEGILTEPSIEEDPPS
jgi:hypothetical protein